MRGTEKNQIFIGGPFFIRLCDLEARTAITSSTNVTNVPDNRLADNESLSAPIEGANVAGIGEESF